MLTPEKINDWTSLKPYERQLLELIINHYGVSALIKKIDKKIRIYIKSSKGNQFVLEYPQAHIKEYVDPKGKLKTDLLLRKINYDMNRYMKINTND